MSLCHAAHCHSAARLEAQSCITACSRALCTSAYGFGFGFKDASLGFRDWVQGLGQTS